jgi:hypothetical protein
MENQRKAVGLRNLSKLIAENRKGLKLLESEGRSLHLGPKDTNSTAIQGQSCDFNKPESITAIKHREEIRKFKDGFLDGLEAWNKIFLVEKRDNQIRQTSIYQLDSNINVQNKHLTNGKPIDTRRYKLPSVANIRSRARLLVSLSSFSDNEIKGKDCSSSSIRQLNIHLKKANCVADSSMMKIVKMQRQLRRRKVPHQPDLTLKVENFTITKVSDRFLSTYRKSPYSRRKPLRVLLPQEISINQLNSYNLPKFVNGQPSRSCGPIMRLSGMSSHTKRDRNVLTPFPVIRRNSKNIHRRSFEKENLDLSLTGRSLIDCKEIFRDSQFRSLPDNKHDPPKERSIHAAEKKFTCIEQSHDFKAVTRRSHVRPPIFSFKASVAGDWKEAISEAGPQSFPKPSLQGFSFFQVRKVSQNQKIKVPVKRAILLKESLPESENTSLILRNL